MPDSQLANNKNPVHVRNSPKIAFCFFVKRAADFHASMQVRVTF